MIDLELTGRRAFISGSTQGIGYAIAEALLAQGASVVINGRDPERVDAAVATLRATSPQAPISGIAADFGDAAEVEELIASLGEIDILVSNVGLFDLQEFARISDAEWSRYLEVNLMSAVRLARATLPGMLARGSGRVILIGSESGVNVPADMIHYGVTKAAMIALGNGLAKLTRGTEVTVNTILGGPTFSTGVSAAVEHNAQAHGIPAEQMKSAIIGQNRTTLLERFIEPREIAHLALYLASPLASATNGAALRADGGVLTAML